MSEQTGPPPDPEAQRVEDLDSRFAKLETEQAEQKGMLTQILDKVGGKAGAEEGKAHAAAQDHTEKHLDRGSTALERAGDIAEQVRRAVVEVNAEGEAKKRQAEHDQEHERIRKLAEAERPPREPQGGMRARLQRGMYGGDK